MTKQYLDNGFTIGQTIMLYLAIMVGSALIVFLTFNLLNAELWIQSNNIYGPVPGYWDVYWHFITFQPL